MASGKSDKTAVKAEEKSDAKTDKTGKKTEPSDKKLTKKVSPRNEERSEEHPRVGLVPPPPPDTPSLMSAPYGAGSYFSQQYMPFEMISPESLKTRQKELTSQLSTWLRISFTRPSISECLPLPSTIVVLSLSMVIFFSLAEIADLNVLELDAQIFRDRLAAGDDGDILQHRLAPIAEARSLDGRDLQRATQLVDHKRSQCFTFDIFRDDDQRLAALGNLLKQQQ